jgi:hypothetical protein
MSDLSDQLRDLFARPPPRASLNTPLLPPRDQFLIPNSRILSNSVTPHPLLHSLSFRLNLLSIFTCRTRLFPSFCLVATMTSANVRKPFNKDRTEEKRQVVKGKFSLLI